MREQTGLTMEDKPGLRIGNYELVKRIDVGGMGEVYLAHQVTAFNRPVAIKIIRSDLIHDITARARFLREAEVNAHLKHEHILPLYEFGDVDGRLFLVTPYIGGGNLATRLKKGGALSLEDTRLLFVPLVQAVAYIHRRGVIHRDLKPTNILLDAEDGVVYVRLIDFGIASLQGHNASPQLTTAGEEVGTVAYMAPERLLGIAAPSNDIFSLGVILHQMLTARMPGTSSSKAPLPQLPGPLEMVVQRSIAVNPSERYTSADELLAAFEDAYRQVAHPDWNADYPATVTGNQGGPRDTSQATAVRNSQPAQITLQRSGEIAAFSPNRSGQSHPTTQEQFAPDDYTAPTTSFHVSSQTQFYRQPPTSRPPLIQPRLPRQQPQKQRSSLLLIISLVMFVLLVVIGGMLFYGYQTVSAVSVTVNFTPQLSTVSQVFSLKADPNVRTIELSQAVIPAPVATSTQSQSQMAQTTGKVGCTLEVFNCKQGVSQEDVDALQSAIQQKLEPAIQQVLMHQVAVAHGIAVTQVQFSNPNATSNPEPGQVGTSVSVTLSETGSLGYIISSDATQIARQKLNAAIAQLGQSYQVIASTVEIGQPVVQGVEASGLIDIQVPGGAVASYQFSQAQLQSISASLVGKSLAQAIALLKNQPGLNPDSVSVSFSTGNGTTMPGDAQHITMKQLPPPTIPGVQMTPVHGITPVSN